jgi:Zn-dependent M28 family amino/carboxypeptidase
LVRQGVAAVLTPENEQVKENRAALSANTPSFTSFSDDFKDGGGPPANFNVVFLGEEAAKALQAMADGVTLSLGGPLAPAEARQTWNVIGVQKGANPTGDAIILSAHMDHVGMQQNAPGEDKIFNGADDDASGCVAVLELARILGAGPQPKRTIYYVFFGSEEAGGYGARYFLKKPPVPIEKMAANLEFEMIGRPDAKVKPEELWLTGYERSNLGPELARQGAKLVPDPHPDQQFFMRSDNYALARMGVVAHTVSSFGLHKEYHQPNDDIAHIDFKHMTQAINSLVAPVAWLVNSDFRPTWVEGKKP